MYRQVFSMSQCEIFPHMLESYVTLLFDILWSVLSKDKIIRMKQCSKRTLPETYVSTGLLHNKRSTTSIRATHS